MHRSRPHIILFVGLFVLALYLPLADGLFGVLSPNVNNEKRELAKRTVSNSKLSFLKNYLTNFDDNFNGRSLLINGYIGFKSKLLHTNPLPQKVIFGKNGYKFLVNYNSMDDYRNVHPFTQSTLDSIGLQVAANQRFLDSIGVKYYISVVPTKPHIYPEFLPDYVKKAGTTRRLDQLKDYLFKKMPSLRLVDLTDTLLASKPQGDLYFKGDSHWNELCAFIGYTKLMQFIREDFPEIPVRKIEDYNKTMGYESDLDLDKILGMDICYSEPAIKLVPNFQSSVETLAHEYAIPEIKKNNPSYVISLGNAKGKRKLVMFRDSFSVPLTQFMAESFEKSIFIWKYPIDRDFIITERPDIVVQQLVERHIDLLKI
jgi:hypothetical protein